MKKIASILTIAGLITAANLHDASAGSRISLPVAVYTTYATGAMSSAYNSADSVQFIECNVIGWPNARQGNCTARNAAGVTRTCFTQDAPMLDVIQSLDSDDYVGFAVNSGGRCTYIEIINNSGLEPKR